MRRQELHRPARLAALPRAAGRAEPRPSPSRSGRTAAARLQLPSGRGVGYRPRRTAAAGCRYRREAALADSHEHRGGSRVWLRDLTPSGREASGAAFPRSRIGAAAGSPAPRGPFSGAAPARASSRQDGGAVGGKFG